MGTERTLYVSDLDGTLLGPDSRVGAESARLLSELAGRGAMITVATARTPATVQVLMADTGLRLPAIVMTGAAMWDTGRRRYVATSYLDPGVAVDVLGVFRRHGLSPFCYTLDDAESSVLDVYHAPKLTHAESRFVGERNGLVLKKFHYQAPLSVRSTVERSMLIFGIGPREVTRAVAAELEGVEGCSFSSYDDIFNRSTGYVEVFAAGVSKASAVKRLAEATGADEIVAFGDNLNDLPLFEAADRAYAVANAVEETRRAATGVIGPNSEDAVARFIAGDFRSRQ